MILVVNPTDKKSKAKQTQKGKGWPPGFFKETFGSIPDLSRAPQGEYEEREALE